MSTVPIEDPAEDFGSRGVLSEFLGIMCSFKKHVVNFIIIHKNNLL